MPVPAILLLLFFVVLVLLFQCFSAVTVGSYSTVKYLPGFPGPLPFELETGYVSVGDSNEIQIFHYFIKSDGNPQTDPLIIWFTGGPGCSALSALAFEIGPIGLKGELDNGTLPQLIFNPYSWTKISSIIFIDLPVGTGFSYAKNSQVPKSGDSSQIRHALQFSRKWLIDHPEFISNPFYIGGDSYAGMIVPVVAQQILQGNERHISPLINFQGYILGNPFTTPIMRENFQIPFAHRMALISNELFESLKTSCQEKYVNIDPSNVECLRHYDTFKKSTSKLRFGCILWPKCSSLRQPDIPGHRSLYSLSADHKCPENEYKLSSSWANEDQVRRALHIHEGSIGEWVRCKGKDYDYELDSVFSYHVNLSSKGYRSLIYSGDHDMEVPHLDTQAWIKALNYSIVDDWRPWFIEEEVAGYTRSYANKMTFATIKVREIWRVEDIQLNTHEKNAAYYLTGGCLENPYKKFRGFSMRFRNDRRVSLFDVHGFDVSRMD